MAMNDEFEQWRDRRAKGSDSILRFVSSGIATFGVPFAALMYFFKLASDDRFSPLAKSVCVLIIIFAGGGLTGVINWRLNEQRFKAAEKKFERERSGVEKTKLESITQASIPDKYLFLGAGVVCLVLVLYLIIAGLFG